MLEYCFTLYLEVSEYIRRIKLYSDTNQKTLLVRLYLLGSHEGFSLEINAAVKTAVSRGNGPLLSLSCHLPSGRKWGNVLKSLHFLGGNFANLLS